MRSADVRAAISVAYRQPEWATFFEVSDGTGSRKTRSADAVAINMYPSRGLSINGFEIKVDRGDWRRELADPAKAEAIAQFCDFWWVAAPKGLIDPTTLPATWGLTEVDEKGALRIKVQAKALKSKAVTRTFFAALCRSKACADEAVVKALVDVEMKRSFADRTTAIEREVARKTTAADAIIQKHAAFSAAMGRHGRLNHLKEETVLRGLEMLDDLGILTGWGPIKSFIAAAKSAATAIEGVEKKYLTEEGK